MATVKELNEAQLKQQLVKTIQSFKAAQSDEEKLKFKKMHAVLKAELDLRQNEKTEINPIPKPAEANAESSEGQKSDRKSIKKGRKSGVSIRKKAISGKNKTIKTKTSKSLPKTKSDEPTEGSEPVGIKKNRRNLYIGIALVVVLGAAIGSYFLFKPGSDKISTKNETTPSSSQTLEEPNSVLETTPDLENNP